MKNTAKWILASITLFVTFSFFNTEAFAAPAAPGLHNEKQPSGQKFQVTQGGDEYFNYFITTSGDIVTKAQDGYWYYGEASYDGIKPGDSKYGIDVKPSDGLTEENLDSLREMRTTYLNQQSYIYSTNTQSQLPQKVSQSILKAPQSADTMVKKPSGPQKLLVVLVSFKDVTIQSTEAYWQNQCFGTTGKTLHNYFAENSNNKFYFDPANESYTANNGIIQITLNQNHPNYGSDFDQAEILEDAIIKGIDSYVNYADFDTNKNGYIDVDELHILTVVAGYEAASTSSTPSVWAHRGYLTSTTCDNMQIMNYTQIGEMNEGDTGYYPAKIGTVCHELSHDLGLKDLYDTDDTNGTSDGVGIFSLMGAGNWGFASGEEPGTSPSHLDPWSKILLGFVTPTAATGGNQDVMSLANGYNVIKVPTSDPLQYFLVENRELNGFDAGLAPYTGNGKGILIWHIDENVLSEDVLINGYHYTRFKGNQVNGDVTHKGVDLEEADEELYGSNLDNSLSSEMTTYFYTDNNSVFGRSTTPGSSLYDGTDSLITISIKNNPQDTMSVNINRTPVPANDTFNVISGNALTIQPSQLLANDTDADGNTISVTNVSAVNDTSFGTLIQNGDGSLTYTANAGKTGQVTFTYTASDGIDMVPTAATVTINILPSTITVGFNSTGGSSVSSQNIANGSKASIPTAPAKSGYTFVGWYTDLATTIPYDFNTALSSNITLYAKWNKIINNYVVSFNSNGGSAVGSQTITEGNRATLPAAPALNGYTFNGWCADSGLTAWFDFNSAITGNITLFAKWTRIIPNYQVVFNSNGGNVITGQTIAEGGRAIRPSNPTKSGYSFVGWYSDPAYQNAFDFNNAITGNITLYTNWISKPSKVTSVKAAAKGHKSIKISWKSVRNVSGYAIYQSTSNSGTYKLVATTQQGNYTIKNLKAKKKYYYKVKAYKLSGSTKIYSSYSSTMNAVARK
jgi:Listeria/Bacterioides repeat/M6 family metalloprotease domain